MVTPVTRMHAVIVFQRIDQLAGAQTLRVQRAVDVIEPAEDNRHHPSDARQAQQHTGRTQRGGGGPHRRQ
ncbi:Uncharacterised protein [Pseudomonas fragi]|uniref:Uncharacterized protein n=1 Tax=Pseudomonas fragi TaxID=296 RepID=A0A449IGH6_PSEFR|nr:Uncharacterised protein [Pseudomonas fragi]